MGARPVSTAWVTSEGERRGVAVGSGRQSAAGFRATAKMRRNGKTVPWRPVG